MSLQDQINHFLDGLRDSAVTNMIGSVPYIIEEFPDLSNKEAREYLHEWMRTY